LGFHSANNENRLGDYHYPGEKWDGLQWDSQFVVLGSGIENASFQSGKTARLCYPTGVGWGLERGP